MGGGGLIALAAGSVLASLLGACGDGGESFPAAAEPAESPALSEPPAGMTFAVGNEPEGLVVDGRTGLAAAITRDPSALTIADIDRRRVVASVPLPATGRHLALARSGGHAVVLIPIEQTDELVEVELPSAESRSIAVGDHPHDVAATAGRTFVGDEFADTVTVLEGERTIASLDAPEQPGGLAAAGAQVAVVAVAERVLAIYDARTLEAVGEAPAGDGPTHVVAASGRAWVADTDGDAVLSFVLAPDPELVSSAELPGAPYGIAVDERRDRLWVTLTERNQVVEYDVSATHPVELARYPTLRQPNSIAVDPRDGAAVVAGRAAGRLEVIGGRR